MTQKLLRELVALPSVNPALLPAGHACAGEKSVAEFLAATAAQGGLDVAFQDVLPGRPNLIVRLAPRGPVRRRLLLAPHLDTVAGDDEQFRPRVAGGRLYGRGACDTKGSVAAMLGALLSVAKNGKRPEETEIVFAGLVDEEVGHAGADALVRAGWQADLAIVGEPTRLQVVTSHKGAVWLKLKTRGQSAHGSCPERGRNAVHEMARIVDAVETDYAATLRKTRPHPLLGHGTINVGSIRGGTQPNIVPDVCNATIDRRTLPGETERRVRAELAAFLKHRGLRAEISALQSSAFGALETDPALPWVRQFSRLAGQKKPAGVTFFCDASVLAESGIPSVVFGPGDIAQAHTADEWISLRSLDKAAGLLTRFMRELP
ncbi:MAG TPA: M20/M25/M40 family metallo-hydrolase [Verrucomicrobiae bacterium]|jgi:acetylornithine deacetylase/succinyl-diaminopimelate desuccinylase-like protein|nr:M20/M25/M40 family metallo-hydrolase [Verrucomicrobiae bacterium]